MKLKSGILLLVIMVLVGFFAFLALNGMPLWNAMEIAPLTQEINLGLDLQGGLYVVYEAQTDPDNPDLETQISKAKGVIRERLDRKGQNEATISQQGADRIVVEIPGVEDPAGLADFLAEPAVLTFTDPEGNIVLTGQDVKSAKPSYAEGQQPVVNFELYPEGADKFADATRQYVGQRISIELDGAAISQPIVKNAIVGGRGIIENIGSIEDAKDLAIKIESGALPVELKQLETRTIGATLGANALDTGIVAGIVGIIAVLLFMLLFYRLPGLVADISLVAYLIIVLYILVAGNITLTLPGVAGIILTVGMAVDANVIIFERMKEERRTGKTLRAAVDAGFHKAFRAIIDANITTLIAAVVLLALGTGPIQGFAKTLMIGILVSMFSAIVLTRWLLRMLINIRIKQDWLYMGRLSRDEGAQQ
jgi:preprotein translocase subunit SecD